VLRLLEVPAAALLPLRIFLGATFVYAGLDKLLDPNFFDPESGASIQAQFHIFERASPLAPLIHLVEPYAVVLGVLIALGEIAVGLGALTGLVYRLAALGGAAISLLFFLTASWTTHPFYFGNDLPYAFGWLTLALAGHGGLLVVPFARWAATAESEVVPARRAVLQVVGLGLLTFVVAGSGGLVRLLRGESGHVVAEPSPGPFATPGASSSPGSTASASAAPTSTATPGIRIATASEVSSSGAQRFTVPLTAPAPLPAGDPAVVIALDDGSFVAYDTVCTHAGCRVGFDRLTATLVCPCHGAEFDPADHGAVVAGPTTIPLVELPLVVNSQDGTIALALR
jgi:thiosulfate dehydrogenase [quinone] large subunit